MSEYLFYLSISGQLGSSETIRLPAKLEMGGCIGYRIEKVKRYLSNGLEILTTDCDASPAYSKLDPNDLPDGVEDEEYLAKIISDEFAICLHKRKQISWFLMKHEKIVTRAAVNKITTAVRAQRAKIIHVEHRFRAGVTTICRHALYQLHREFLCAQITDIDAIEDVIVELKSMSENCGLPLLVLVDLKEKMNIADVLLDYSKKRLVTAI